MRQLPLAMRLEAAPGFSNFTIGANAAAVASLRARPLAPTPIYLWSATGAGKSHLLQALARDLAENGERVGAVSPASALPWEWDEGWSALLIDDCHALDADHQHAAFAFFVEAQTHGVPVIAAGRLPPVDLPLRDDLRTRLGWGLVFQIEPPVEEDVRATLRREADRRGLFLSDDVMSYLMTRLARDLGSLMGLLDRLDEFALERQRAITVPLVREMLSDPEAAKP